MSKAIDSRTFLARWYDQTVYHGAEEFGKLGRAWREADYETTDLETVIQDLLSGQYNNRMATDRG